MTTEKPPVELGNFEITPRMVSAGAIVLQDRCGVSHLDAIPRAVEVFDAMLRAREAEEEDFPLGARDRAIIAAWRAAGINIPRWAELKGEVLDDMLNEISQAVARLNHWHQTKR